MSTPPLSPAAQAVLDAADNQPFKKPDGDLNLEGAIAAALRAAADQCTDGAAHWKMYAIAAELESLS